LFDNVHLSPWGPRGTKEVLYLIGLHYLRLIILHTIVTEPFWHKLNYFSFCRIFEKIFITCAKILISYIGNKSRHVFFSGVVHFFSFFFWAPFMCRLCRLRFQMMRKNMLLTSRGNVLTLQCARKTPVENNTYQQLSSKIIPSLKIQLLESPEWKTPNLGNSVVVHPQLIDNGFRV
jgi:hypothetical protein